MGNPFVRLLLRSPLHGMMSRSVMLITVTGKRTGRSFTLPVQYARAGFVLYVIPGNPRAKTWWRNVVGGAPVTLRLRGRDVEASAAVLNGGHAIDREEVEEGMRVFLARFPAAARVYGIRRSADGTLDEESLRAAIDAIVMVVVTPES